jgi:hypothetical protein
MVNSRLTELLNITRSSSRAEGVLEGRKERKGGETHGRHKKATA